MEDIIIAIFMAHMQHLGGCVSKSG